MAPKILLAYKAPAAGGEDYFSALLPVGLGTINAFLRAKGANCRTANFSSFTWEETAKALATEQPAILGISQFTHNRFESLKLARLAKQIIPDCFVLLGGPHATHRFKEILQQNPAVDAVALGEGEETFADLLECLRSQKNKPQLQEVLGLALRRSDGVSLTPSRPPLTDLDALPFPAVFLDDAIGVDAHQQLEFLITSRGCPASCSFCSSPQFWGKKVRFRSPSSIAEEIKYIRDRYGLIYFSIRDDTFTADRQRVMRFCRKLIEEKLYVLWNCQSRVNAVDAEMLALMKRAGCECIQFGVESGSPRILDLLGKRITPEQVKQAASGARRAGINVSIYLINGVPGETERDLQLTLKLLDGIKAQDGQVSPLAFYPGTALFETAVALGTISKNVFETDRRPALFVRSDDFVPRSTRAILTHIEQVAAASAFTQEEFHRQKNYVGYCHATNVMAGEYFESIGELGKAEAEYLEILEREPENPWGWLMAGELYVSMGDTMKARNALHNLLVHVPASPGFSLMQP